MKLILEDGGTYGANKFQRWLDSCWLDFCKQVPNGATVEINGDVFQGIHAHRDTALVTASYKDQLRIAKAVVKPLIARASRIYVVRGTDYHDGAVGANIEDFAEAIGAEKNTDTGQYSSWELYLRRDNLLFYFTHHISIAPVYPSTPMARLMREAKESFVDHGLPIPDVQVYSHTHQHRKFPDGDRWLFVTPAWQLANGYAHKVAPRRLPTIGGMIFETAGGLSFKAKLYKIPPPRIVVEK